MRWKAHFFLNPAENLNKDTYGFKTTKSPPPVRELSEFEATMTILIQNIKFKTGHTSEFQKNLRKDSKRIQRDSKLWIAADKTSNFYRVGTELYNQLLEKSITKSYKKAPANKKPEIISVEKNIAESLDLGDRIDALAENESFVTLKDHKPNFANDPSCRLINPTKSEIGLISQKILQRVNAEVVKATGVNQWKNTISVIEWFKNIPNKPSHSFICFDIVEFYPSITEDLLEKALEFASTITNIPQQEKEIIIKIFVIFR